MAYILFILYSIRAHFPFQEYYSIMYFGFSMLRHIEMNIVIGKVYKNH